MDGKLILVLTGTPSREEAQRIADQSVERGLAAAVQIIGPVTSTYRWKGTTEHTEEWLCLLKTAEALYSETERLVRALHSYELPGILTIPLDGGSAPYLAWYTAALRPPSDREELLSQLDSAHERLIGAAEAAEQDGSVRIGTWGPREILAHIIGWEAEATARIPRLAAGDPRMTYDEEAFNHAILTTIGAQSFAQVRDLLRTTHRRLTDVLRSQHDAVFLPGHRIRTRVTAMTNHSDEHAGELEAAVARIGRDD